MQLGEAHRTSSGVIGTDQHSLWSPRRGQWSKPRGDEVGMTKWDLALGTDCDRGMGIELQLKVPRSEAMKSEKDKSSEAFSKHSRGAKTYDNQTGEIQ